MRKIKTLSTFYSYSDLTPHFAVPSYNDLPCLFGIEGKPTGLINSHDPFGFQTMTFTC